MAMSTTILAATGLAAANALLLLVLTAVWVRNYRKFRTSLILGLIVFGAVMLLENAMAIAFFLSMNMLYSGDPGVQTSVAVLRGLQFVALLFLTWVTLK